jgi:FAM32A
MGDYDFKPSGSLKLKGVKDKKIKKSKKEKSTKEAAPKKSSPEPDEDTTTKKYVVAQTEAEKRFEEIQRQRVPHPRHPRFVVFMSVLTGRWQRKSRRLLSRAIGRELKS